MKTLFITLMTAFVFTLNTSAFAACDHDHKHEKTEKHNEHHAEGDHTEHDGHEKSKKHKAHQSKGDKVKHDDLVDHEENADKNHGDHTHDHSEDKTKGDK